jgi:hypothetical protein
VSHRLKPDCQIKSRLLHLCSSVAKNSWPGTGARRGRIFSHGPTPCPVRRGAAVLAQQEYPPRMDADEHGSGLHRPCVGRLPWAHAAHRAPRIRVHLCSSVAENSWPGAGDGRERIFSYGPTPCPVRIGPRQRGGTAVGRVAGSRPAMTDKGRRSPLHPPRRGPLRTAHVR